MYKEYKTKYIKRYTLYKFFYSIIYNCCFNIVIFIEIINFTFKLTCLMLIKEVLVITKLD